MCYKIYVLNNKEIEIEQKCMFINCYSYLAIYSFYTILCVTINTEY